MKKFAMFTALLSSALMTPAAHAQRFCSNSDLQGTFSFVAFGTLGGAGFVAAGTGTYDGNGGVKGVININLSTSASGATGPLNWTGNYTVNADCTATKAITIPGVGVVHFFISAGDNFGELRFVATDPGAVVSGTARKQQP